MTTESTIRPALEVSKLLLFALFLFALLGAAGYFFWLKNWLGYLIAVLCMGSAMVFLLALIVPSRFVVGVRVTPDGFEYRRPLRKPVFIAYAEIVRIDAVKYDGGNTNDEVILVAHTTSSKASILE
jgi:hypothetical protein